ncbi:hypothetical protein DPMN_105068 [Dreissena polymorpha]|uniref:Uncharacterized protein n=1 Tax=Dreissena polymorpha TaxID=45954 RepID=A0A9D4K371_DREPO|nr:hypothetical protein DPMN_105068 [Dreissena polymorpha]
MRVTYTWGGTYTFSHCPSSFSSGGFDGDLPLACHAESLAQIVVPGDVSKPSLLPSFDGRLKGFLWANTCCCQVMKVLVGLVFHVYDAEKSSETHVLKGLYSAFCARVLNVQVWQSYSQMHRFGRGLMVLIIHILFSLGITTIVVAILIPFSVLVPSLNWTGLFESF